MNETRAMTWLNEADRQKDMRRQNIANIKRGIKMFAHGHWWDFLHATHLAGPYSRLMCRLGLYRKFADGRCMWCGHVHAGKSREGK